jgi:hypothetical protein
MTHEERIVRLERRIRRLWLSFVLSVVCFCIAFTSCIHLHIFPLLRASAIIVGDEKSPAHVCIGDEGKMWITDRRSEAVVVISAVDDEFGITIVDKNGKEVARFPASDCATNPEP